LCDKTLSF